MSNIAIKACEHITILASPEGQPWPTWQEILKEFFQNGRGGLLQQLVAALERLNGEG